MSETNCELPDQPTSEEELRRILADYRVVAVVGLSNDPERDSHRVAEYLAAHGYRVIPVNPQAAEILGEKSYPSLHAVAEAEKVEIVDIFRRPDAIPAIVDQAIAIGAKVIWMQLGLSHHQAAERARAAGLAVVQSRCIKEEHRRLRSGR
jgi:predicted CoA-binding protein